MKKDLERNKKHTWSLRRRNFTTANWTYIFKQWFSLWTDWDQSSSRHFMIAGCGSLCWPHLSPEMGLQHSKQTALLGSLHKTPLWLLTLKRWTLHRAYFCKNCKKISKEENWYDIAIVEKKKQLFNISFQDIWWNLLAKMRSGFLFVFFIIFSFIHIIVSDCICQVLVVTDQTSGSLLRVQRDLIRTQGWYGGS